MAFTKSETKQFLDCSAEDFSPEIQALLQEDRELYDMQKALRKKIVQKMNEQNRLSNGKVIVGMGFTRWGQLQVHIDNSAQPKVSKSSNRPSLADFLNEQDSSGRNR